MSELHDDVTFTSVGGQGAEREKYDVLYSLYVYGNVSEFNGITFLLGQCDSDLARHLFESAKILRKIIWMLM